MNSIRVQKYAALEAAEHRIDSSVAGRERTVGAHMDACDVAGQYHPEPTTHAHANYDMANGPHLRSEVRKDVQHLHQPLSLRPVLVVDSRVQACD